MCPGVSSFIKPGICLRCRYSTSHTIIGSLSRVLPHSLHSSFPRTQVQRTDQRPVRLLDYSIAHFICLYSFIAASPFSISREITVLSGLRLLSCFIYYLFIDIRSFYSFVWRAWTPRYNSLALLSVTLYFASYFHMEMGRESKRRTRERFWRCSRMREIHIQCT